MTVGLRTHQPNVTQGGWPRVGNSGLEVDRYLPEAIGGENRPLQDLLQRVCGAPPPRLYQAAYDRWQSQLAAWTADDPAGPTVARAEFAVQGRLIVGLGAESVRETAITLHRAFGVPFIPGSALKGLARRYATATLRETDPSGQADATWKQKVQRALFGDQASASYFVFFDAWYVPGSADGNRPLRRDVITVHHPTYYGSGGQRGPGPWDFDDPTPVPFVSATGRFLVAVRGPDRAWAAFALELLTRALGEWGVGAKTSSGYGRLAPVNQAAAATEKTALDPALVQQIDALNASIAALPGDPAGLGKDLSEVVASWRALPDELPAKLQTAKAICAKLKAAGVLDQWATQPRIRGPRLYATSREPGWQP